MPPSLQFNSAESALGPMREALVGTRQRRAETQPCGRLLTRPPASRAPMQLAGPIPPPGMLRCPLGCPARESLRQPRDGAQTGSRPDFPEAQTRVDRTPSASAASRRDWTLAWLLSSLSTRERRGAGIAAATTLVHYSHEARDVVTTAPEGPPLVPRVLAPGAKASRFQLRRSSRLLARVRCRCRLCDGGAAPGYAEHGDPDVTRPNRTTAVGSHGSHGIFGGAMPPRAQPARTGDCLALGRLVPCDSKSCPGSLSVHAPTTSDNGFDSENRHALHAAEHPPMPLDVPRQANFRHHHHHRLPQ